MHKLVTHITPILLLLASCELPVHFVASWSEPPDGGVPPADAASPETSSWCTAQADCPTSHVCSWATGECVAATGAICGLPETSGTRPDNYPFCVLEDCTPSSGDACYTHGCGEGAVCVPGQRWRFPDGGQEYVANQGTCLQTCDPCAASAQCPAGQDCFALAERGGFCHPRDLGVDCLQTRVCPLGQLCVEDTCAPTCRPASATITQLTRASLSPDCGGSEVCVRTESSNEGFSFICREGEILAWGSACGLDPEHYCPTFCIHQVCSPSCASEPCPDGLTCFEVVGADLGGTRQLSACIEDHALPSGYFCAEDRNCAEGLSCLPATVALTCQLAP